MAWKPVEEESLIALLQQPLSFDIQVEGQRATGGIRID
jgi:hypothetical protein